MTAVLAIDPGSEQSGWVLLSGRHIFAHGTSPNVEVLEMLGPCFEVGPHPESVVAIELIEPRYGATTGWETLDTCRWVGRFEQAAQPLPVALLKRSDILRHLGIPGRGANADAGVRAALLDRWGGRDKAIGRKAAPGPLRGVTGHVWQALAVAVTWLDRQEEAA